MYVTVINEDILSDLKYGAKIAKELLYKIPYNNLAVKFKGRDSKFPNNVYNDVTKLAPVLARSINETDEGIYIIKKIICKLNMLGYSVKRSDRPVLATILSEYITSKEAKNNNENNIITVDVPDSYKQNLLKLFYKHQIFDDLDSTDTELFNVIKNSNILIYVGKKKKK